MATNYDDDMEPFNIVYLEYEELVSYTDNFSERNYIGRFQFGKLYRGNIGEINVMVKIWEVPEIQDYEDGENELRLMEEMILLRHELIIKHPCMVKLYGYCCKSEHLSVVYDFKAVDSAFNLIRKDSFTWLQRIKAAFGLASLLKFLHAGKSSTEYTPFIVQNLDAAHIVFDQDYNPKLCDFAQMTGGILPDKGTFHAMGCSGYVGIGAHSRGTSNSEDCSNKQDVFAFGVILLSLISKRVYREEDMQSGLPTVYEWALGQCEAFESYSAMRDAKFSLVHQSIAGESEFCGDDAHKITMIALDCVNRVESERPVMKQVFRSLLKLEVVKNNADFIGANNKMLLRPCENTK